MRAGGDAVNSMRVFWLLVPVWVVAWAALVVWAPAWSFAAAVFLLLGAAVAGVAAGSRRDRRGDGPLG